VTHTPSPHTRQPRRFHLLWAGLTTALVVFAAACGDSGASEFVLSPEAQQGQRLYNTSGCAGCHGRAGQGGVGPALVDIADTERPLIDGRTVIADNDYLVRAIMDPNIEIVDGYGLRMPSNRLTEAEVQLVIAFITELEPAP
jgi:mono/diheme cytochrome c family protein